MTECRRLMSCDLKRALAAGPGLRSRAANGARLTTGRSSSGDAMVAIATRRGNVAVGLNAEIVMRLLAISTQGHS